MPREKKLKPNRHWGELSQWIKEKLHTQAEAGRRLGVSQVAVSRLVTGSRTNPELQKKLARLVDHTVPECFSKEVRAA